MAKNKVSEYSSTAANNTDIGNINIAEGCAPSGINNAIRELMAQLKDMQSGTDGDSFTVGGDLLVSGSTSTFTNNVILGSASTSSVTLNAATVTIPNGLTFSSTNAVKIPVGTTAQRPTASTGQIRYNSSNSQFEGYNGTAWGQLGGGATGGGGDTVFVENSNAVTVDYTITTNKNAMSAGDVTINTGVTVTLPTGSRWVIV